VEGIRKHCSKMRKLILNGVISYVQPKLIILKMGVHVVCQHLVCKYVSLIYINCK